METKSEGEIPSGKRKKKNFKVLITPRDEDILKAVAEKPVPLSYIKEKYFKKGSRILSDTTISLRISKLVKGSYLSKNIVDGKYHIGVGEEGVRYLSEKLGYDINRLKVFKLKSTLPVKIKPPPNGSIIVTPRDINIFERLACGPASFASLRTHFKKSDGKPCSQQMVSKRLHKLSGLGYLKKVAYPFKPSLIYYLGDMGSQYLISNLNYEPERIRTHIVKKDNLAHELIITEIVKAIKKEESKALYEVNFLYDDHYQRQLSTREKGVLFPDLCVSISTSIGTKYTYYIEVDTGKRSSKLLVEKIKYYKHKILLITPTSKRRSTLQNSIISSNDESLIPRIGLAVFGDIVKDGLVGCKTWKRADKTPLNIV